MNSPSEPLVTVVTPVYNGDSFLAECIDSVLAQTYKNYEYIIVNNCSTDRSLEIASRYAEKYGRVRVHTNKTFVGVIENHNIAFSLMSPMAKYCKVVSADDFIFSDCIERLVQCAEENPSAGIVGSYQLSGRYVKWQGFQYPRAVFSGAKLSRSFLLMQQAFIGSQPIFGFGTPTSLLYRADLVRENMGQFYPNSSPHADTSACFKYLQKRDFGFVYQVLSYERTHDATQSAKSKEMNRYLSAMLNDLTQYGPIYLSTKELELQIKACLKAYYEFLAVNCFTGRGKEFWDYHKGRFEEIGYPLNRMMLIRAALVKVLQEIVNPQHAVQKILGRVFSNHCGIDAGQPYAAAAKTVSSMHSNSGGMKSGC